MTSWADPSPANYDVINFCSAHRAPLLPISDNTIYLEIGERGTLDRSKHAHVVNCFEEVPYAKPLRRELALVSALIASSHFIRRTKISPDTLVNFTTHRLFVMPDKTEHHSPSMQMNFLTSEEVGNYREFISPTKADRPYLLPFFFHRERIEINYGKRHSPTYFPKYLQCAVEEGVLTELEADQCSQNVLHLTAMGAGRMPARVFCDISDNAEQVTLRFLRDFAPSKPEEETFQVALYLYERLAIFLLEKHVRNQFGIIPLQIYGYWTLVDENRRYEAGVFEQE